MMTGTLALTGSARWRFLRTTRRDLPGLYNFLLNKWYFDELYDLIFVRPAKWLGRFLWKKGDGFIIDGFGPTASPPRVLTCAQCRRASDRLSLSLCLRDADRRRRGSSPGSCRAHRGPVMMLGFGRCFRCTFLPLVGAILIAVQRAATMKPRARKRPLDRAVDHARHLRGVARSGLVSLRSGRSGFQFVEKMRAGWRRHRLSHGCRRHFAAVRDRADGRLMPLCILASGSDQDARAGIHDRVPVDGNADGRRVRALDLVLFYLFFEGGLIPMFLIIGIWGGPRRIYASFKFFLYTLLGSVLMLLAIMAHVSGVAGTTDIRDADGVRFPPHVQTWLWLAFFASFAVKMPMWPVHTWLPDAHVEAPTAGSVMLAGVLLKMGGYGFLRFSLPMFPRCVGA
jgi:hypothetical protein